MVILALLLLAGCATSDVRPDAFRQELQRRNVLQLEVGPEVALSRASFGRLESVVDSAGAAHIVGIDWKGQIHHIAVEPTGAPHDEIIGSVPQAVDSDKAAFDIVEFPAGIIRIAAGDSEYARPLAGGEWARTGGNRCRQYLAHASSLYCAFVASGEEVGTAPRTDVNVGLVLILPIAWPSTVRPGKLVLAERVDASWVVRTVIDPATDWTADETDLRIGVDRRDMVHVVFAVGHGGIGCFVGGGGYSFGGGCQNLKDPEMRYARFLLLAAGPRNGARADWQEVQSAEGIGSFPEGLSTMKMSVSGADGKPASAYLTRPYRRHMAVAPNAAVALALVEAHYSDWRHGPIVGIGTSVLGGNSYEALALDAFPLGDYQYASADTFLRIGSDDVQHLLLYPCRGFFIASCQLVYERRAEEGKIATTVLSVDKVGMEHRPSGSLQSPVIGTLATGIQGLVFAAWVTTDRGGSLVGRWIGSRPSAAGTVP